MVELLNQWVAFTEVTNSVHMCEICQSAMPIGSKQAQKVEEPRNVLFAHIACAFPDSDIAKA